MVLYKAPLPVVTLASTELTTARRMCAGISVVRRRVYLSIFSRLVIIIVVATSFQPAPQEDRKVNTH